MEQKEIDTGNGQETEQAQDRKALLAKLQLEAQQEASERMKACEEEVNKVLDKHECVLFGKPILKGIPDPGNPTLPVYVTVIEIGIAPR